jgi:valyl-tRNA synthetase
VNASVILTEQDEEIITDIVWELKVGIKLPEQEIDYNTKLLELEKQLEQEEQFLNWIRKLLSSEWFRKSANPKVVEMKEKKKEEVENKILKIKEEIARIKIKLK